MIFKLKQHFLLLGALCCLIALVGCSSANKQTVANNTETKTAANTPGTTTTVADKIGVPECDTYIEKYEACITGKVPESARQALKTSFEQTRKTWKDLAANPQTKTSLASACKQSQEMAKQSMDAYHCDW